MAQNIPRGTPARVLVLLALLLGLVVVSAWRDALRREASTWLRHPTALGDTRLFLRGEAPVRLNTGGSMILLTAGAATMHRRDDRMYRVATGFGENLPFSIFSKTENFESEAEPRLYARIAPHQFLRLRATIDPPGPLKEVVPASLAMPSPSPAELPIRKALPLGKEEGVFPDKTPENGTL